jgi:Predicted membrane protein
MRIEILTLFASMVLGLMHLIAATQAATKQRGLAWNLSSREGKMPELTGAAARLDRAHKNFHESYIYFVALILLIQIQDRFSVLTLVGSQMYFWSRLIYFPVYGLGIIYVRTALWVLSLLGIIILMASLFI